MPEIGPAELVILPFAYVLPCPPPLLGHQKNAWNGLQEHTLRVEAADVILQRPMTERNKFEK